MRKESYATPAFKTTGDCTCSRYRKASARQSTREHGQFWRSGGQLVSNRNMKRVPIGRGGPWNCLKRMAPQVGLEPTTLRLTAGCSAIELLRNIGKVREASAFASFIITSGGGDENCGAALKFLVGYAVAR